MFLLLFLIISNSLYYLLVSGLARIINLVLAHILHSAENHSWTLMVLFLKLKRHFLKRPSFGKKKKNTKILGHSDSLWRSCNRKGYPTTKCFQICQTSLKWFFLCFKPAVWLTWSCSKKIFSSDILQETLAVSKASVGFFFSSETFDYPVGYGRKFEVRE